MKYFILFLSLCMFCSCGLVRKAFDKNKSHREEQVHITTDSTDHKKSDSTSVKSIDSTTLKKDEKKKEEDVSLEFADSSDNNKVEITTDNNGKQVIKAEGKIKSVKTHKRSETKKSDSTSVAKKDTAAKSSDQHTALKKKVDSSSVSDSKNIHRTTKKWQLPWYVYVIGLIFLVILLLYLYRKYQPKLTAWWSRFRSRNNTS